MRDVYSRGCFVVGGAPLLSDPVEAKYLYLTSNCVKIKGVNRREEGVREPKSPQNDYLPAVDNSLPRSDGQRDSLRDKPQPTGSDGPSRLVGTAQERSRHKSRAEETGSVKVTNGKGVLK